MAAMAGNQTSLQHMRPRHWAVIAFVIGASAAALIAPNAGLPAFTAVGAVATVAGSVLYRFYSGRVQTANGWDFDTMSATKTNFVNRLPYIKNWKDGAFIEAEIGEMLDVAAYCLSTTTTATVAETLAMFDRHREAAHSWFEHAPGRIEAVFDRPAAGSGPLADYGARMFLNIDQVDNRTRVRVVVFTGGFGNGNPAAPVSKAVVSRTMSIIPLMGGVAAGVFDIVADTERSERGAAVWWITVADLFGAGKEAAAQVKGVKLAAKTTAGEFAGMEMKRIVKLTVGLAVASTALCFTLFAIMYFM